MGAIDQKRIERINEIVHDFRMRSDAQQGYIKIEMNNGIQECSWGEVEYRFQSDGRGDGGFEFRSFKELEEKLDALNKKTRKEIVF